MRKYLKKKIHILVVSQQIFVGLEDVLKTSPRHILKTSSTRLQRNNFLSSKTSWRHLARRNFSSWKTKNCYAEVVLKTSWRRLVGMLWRCLEDVIGTNKMFTGNKPKRVSNKSIPDKSISDKSKANPKCIN